MARLQRKGPTPETRPFPPRQTTGLGLRDQPCAERELEPGSDSWPHSSILQGPLPLFPGPIPAVPRLYPTPKTSRLEEAVRDHLLGNLTYPGYQA